MLTRRALLYRFAAGTVLASARPAFVWAADESSAFRSRIASLESRHGGRIGVSVFDTGSDQNLTHRGHTRFSMCSTVKWPLVALILSRVDAGHESLDRTIDYSAAELVTYSPETKKHVDSGMRLGAICRAGLTQSDNTAANLMFDAVGGPAALTAFIRSLGDDVTRSDRLETALNEPAPGHRQDTTTPIAMTGLMRRVLFGDVLRQQSKQQLIDWMRANQTGDKRLRAGLPNDWQIGDKTGSGGNNTAADIAIASHEHDAPILISVYYTGSNATPAERDEIIADVGRAIVTR